MNKKQPYKEKPYTSIVAHYENCLRRFGDTHLGVDWQKADEADKRYQVMLDIIQPINGPTASLLDFGCGTAGLLDYMIRTKTQNIYYNGLDISAYFIDVCNKKYPNTRFFTIDILDHHILLPRYDYIVLNGVFTEKIDLSHAEMTDYFKSMIVKIFPYCIKGIAFNLRSKQVESENMALFHLSFDELALFLVKNFGRHFIIRNDYELEEYTVYLYSQSSQQ